MIHTGDCIEVMAGMDADSVDAIVTDPPYGLEFMGKEWDSPWRDDPDVGQQWQRGMGKVEMPDGAKRLDRPSYDRTANVKCRTCGKWQVSSNPCKCERPDFPNLKRANGVAFQAWCETWGREALRVTRPGGYLLAFGGTRTHHRLVCGLEDAGWIIRDELDWIYASGFPKGKANLKPAHEPIVLARKPGPLQALAIDECRIPSSEEWEGRELPDAEDGVTWGGAMNQQSSPSHPQGRWPSNVLLSDPELFDERNADVVGSGATAETPYVVRATAEDRGMYSPGTRPVGEIAGYGDSGGYSRFFIVPKADRADREPVVRGQLAPEQRKGDFPALVCNVCGCRRVLNYRPTCGHDDFRRENGQARENAHPTVKPVDLMRHLVRLVTPQGGTVLDPFLGSGSTAIAAELEGFPWVGIEKEPEYVAIAEARLHGTQRGMGLG